MVLDSAGRNIVGWGSWCDGEMVRVRHVALWETLPLCDPFLMSHPVSEAAPGDLSSVYERSSQWTVSVNSFFSLFLSPLILLSKRAEGTLMSRLQWSQLSCSVARLLPLYSLTEPKYLADAFNNWSDKRWMDIDSNVFLIDLIMQQIVPTRKRTNTNDRQTFYNRNVTTDSSRECGTTM